ncbi:MULTISPECIES: hypothetical protein [Roseivirga]|jgi:hypothetical protein|uniref:DUF2116 family Zn-ribbon domain-containing protein n=1 Tax=Roseivirga thermotolerans TaxID=1758176 RepID=A0ABQ3IAV9_9BACT|nr:MULTISPECIES: hypothetical protein [Roseivirga]MEC7754814.1 hypothetical protein [Bacteroidota bacterium]GHE68929.1 hypothetical protein GCM10011340_26020 [Roseivirga thermotolerans]|tara:strand:+ start:3166 stop:3528 length:363 start_codon:yes stop_codon:yes gene_type:complete
MNERKCLECGEVLRGRADKKFCDDACRNAYNNKLNSDANNYMRNVHYLLRRNRRILEELNPEGTSKIARSRLIEKGFDFDYHTSTYTTRAGATYYFCYEYGYLPLEGDQLALVKKKEYIN